MKSFIDIGLLPRGVCDAKPRSDDHAREIFLRDPIFWGNGSNGVPWGGACHRREVINKMTSEISSQQRCTIGTARECKVLRLRVGPLANTYRTSITGFRFPWTKKQSPSGLHTDSKHWSINCVHSSQKRQIQICLIRVSDPRVFPPSFAVLLRPHRFALSPLRRHFVLGSPQRGEEKEPTRRSLSQHRCHRNLRPSSTSRVS